MVPRMRPSSAEATTDSFLRPALAGAAATFSGIGLARFAYVPLFPAMVGAGWISGAEGGFLGAVNLSGYLAGVLGGRRLAMRVGTAAALDLGLALAALSFAAGAWNGGLTWLALWRAGAGVAGGILMALAGPAVQGAVPPAKRGAAGGVVLAGVGTGVIVGSLAVPLVLPAGVSAAWLALAAVVLAMWAFAHPRWPRVPVAIPEPAEVRPSVRPLFLAYGLSGAGMVPHMVYFVDLAVRGRGLDATTGSLTWLLFGAGAIAGTLLSGRAADRLGAARALQIWLAVQSCGVALALVPGTALLAPAAFVGAFGGVGITASALARTRELAGPAAAGAIWVRGTAVYAIAQAGVGFALTALFARTGTHDALFIAGLVLSLAGLAVALKRS